MCVLITRPLTLLHVSKRRKQYLHVAVVYGPAFSTPFILYNKQGCSELCHVVFLGSFCVNLLATVYVCVFTGFEHHTFLAEGTVFHAIVAFEVWSCGKQTDERDGDREFEYFLDVVR